VNSLLQWDDSFARLQRAGNNESTGQGVNLYGWGFNRRYIGDDDVEIACRRPYTDDGRCYVSVAGWGYVGLDIDGDVRPDVGDAGYPRVGGCVVG